MSLCLLSMSGQETEQTVNLKNKIAGEKNQGISDVWFLDDAQNLSRPADATLSNRRAWNWEYSLAMECAIC